MKNPFTINFLALGFIILLCSFILISECQCCHNYNDTFRNIIIGILSSAILLALIEFILLIRDSTKYAFLSGKYKRLEIYQLNENRIRWTKDESIEKNGKRFEYKTDSCYHRLAFYDDLTDIKKIELKYLFNGKYSGTVDYDEGTTKISITLDNTNEMQGKGTYQYTKSTDNKLPNLGTYEIQVDELDKSKIYVYYKNTIPSGLAEGYEIWKKYSPRIARTFAFARFYF